MPKLVILVVVLVVVGVGGFFILSQNNTQSTDSSSQSDENSSMENDSVMNDDTSEMRDPADDTMSTTTGQYIDYSASAYEATYDKKRVLYFHATWCPTCKVTHEEFLANPDKIPNDVVLLKTDYDTERELKQKYGITYQHTFVQVDASGNEINKWNGGGIDKLITEVL